MSLRLRSLTERELCQCIAFDLSSFNIVFIILPSTIFHQRAAMRMNKFWSVEQHITWCTSIVAVEGEHIGPLRRDRYGDSDLSLYSIGFSVFRCYAHSKVYRSDSHPFVIWACRIPSSTLYDSILCATDSLRQSPTYESQDGCVVRLSGPCL